MPLTAVLAGGSVVDLDATVIVQFLAFFVLFLLLRPLLFKPLLSVLVERERATEGDVKEAQKRQVEAEDKMKKYERELERSREKASVEREKIRENGRAREREILEKARGDVEKAMDAGREKMKSQAEEVRTQMNKEIEIISKQVVDAVLGRKAA